MGRAKGEAPPDGVYAPTAIVKNPGKLAGSPRRVALGGLPQIRTCRFPASGSSTHDFAASAIRGPCVDREAASTCRVCCQPPVHESVPPSLPRVPQAGSPGFRGTMRHCDFLTVVSPRFVSFAWRYPGASAVRPRAVPDARPADRSGVCWAGCSWAGLLQGTARISQVPGEPSWPFALFSDPGGTGCALGTNCQRTRRGPRIEPRRRAPTNADFGAQSHGIWSGCLRLAGAVTRHHARLASGCWSQLCRVGFVPTGFLRKVSEIWWSFLLSRAFVARGSVFSFVSPRKPNLSRDTVAT